MPTDARDRAVSGGGSELLDVNDAVDVGTGERAWVWCGIRFEPKGGTTTGWVAAVSVRCRPARMLRSSRQLARDGGGSGMVT